MSKSFCTELSDIILNNLNQQGIQKQEYQDQYMLLVKMFSSKQIQIFSKKIPSFIYESFKSSKTNAFKEYSILINFKGHILQNPEICL